MVMCIIKHGYCSEFSTLQGTSERCCINDTMHPETEMTRKPARTNDSALSAFIEKKAEIDAMLARLQALSDDHFGAGPNQVNWSDLGGLEYQAHLLKQISDFAFGEGEHAA
jgi:hypothetical protein